MYGIRTTLIMTAIVCVVPWSYGVGQETAWNPSKAAEYLDQRQQEWLNNAHLGVGETETACITCHTSAPYLLARPRLRNLLQEAEASAAETKLLQQIKLRVEHFDELDTPNYKLMYDSQKDASRGTEAVLTTFALAFSDSYSGKVSTATTLRAIDNLWKTQITAEESIKGSWPWLYFGLEPWESKNSVYHGTAMAAVALAVAPSYLATLSNDASPEAEKARERIQWMTTYLRTQLPSQNLHNRIWSLWAATRLEGILTKEEQTELIATILAKQHEDHGWSLSDLGDYARTDGTPLFTTSDGYATGLVALVLLHAGVESDRPEIKTALEYLRATQEESGRWRAHSLNKNRNEDSLVGKFMSDAATAFAVGALTTP